MSDNNTKMYINQIPRYKKWQESEIWEDDAFPLSEQAVDGIQKLETLLKNLCTNSKAFQQFEVGFIGTDNGYGFRKAFDDVKEVQLQINLLPYLREEQPNRYRFTIDYETCESVEIWAKSEDEANEKYEYEHKDDLLNEIKDNIDCYADVEVEKVSS